MLKVQTGQIIDESVLIAAGYFKTHVPETWRDIGGPENGPKIIGGPAYDDWRNGNHHIFVVNGVVQENDVWEEGPDNWEDHF